MHGEKSLNELICSNCGNELSKGIKFCSKCGNKNEFYSESETTEQFVKKRIKIPKVVIIVAVLAFIGLFSFNAVAKAFFPDKYAKGAILNSYKALNEDSKNYNGIPGIIPLLSSESVSEKELYLEIYDVSDDYISSILSGYGAKFNLQNDVNSGEVCLNIGIQDDSTDLVAVDFFASKNGFFVSAPLLYDNPVGVNSNADLSTIERNSYYDSMRISLLTQAKILNASIESKKAIEDSLKSFSKDIIKVTKFEKSKTSDDTYTATIKGNDLFNAFKNNANKLLDDNNIVNLMTYSIYMEDYYYSSFEEAKQYAIDSIESAKEMLNELDSEDFGVDDLNIALSVNKDNLVKRISAETTLYNEYGDEMLAELSGDFNYKSDWVDSEVEVELSTDYEEVNFVYEVENSIKDNTKNRDTSLSAMQSRNNQISIKLNEEYDTKSKDYEATITIVPEYEDEGFDIKIGAEYNGKDTLDFTDIRFGFNNYGYYELNLGGYLKSKDIKSVDKAKFNNVEYITDMTDDELDDMGESVSSKMEMIFGDFYYGL